MTINALGPKALAKAIDDLLLGNSLVAIPVPFADLVMNHDRDAAEIRTIRGVRWRVDPSLPDDVIEVRDGSDVLLRIVNIGAK